MKDTRSYCNWEYTGEYDTNRTGYVNKTKWKTDCDRVVNWTRDNKIGKLFKQYGLQSVPSGERFRLNCPFCGNELNLVNPYDDGETCRKMIR